MKDKICPVLVDALKL